MEKTALASVVENLGTTPTRVLPPEGKPFKIDLACGDNKVADAIGIDAFKTASTDYVFDLLKFPWPIDDGVVDFITCNHFFEHIPGKLRPRFMDECFRILKVGAQMAIVVPYWSSMRSVQDFTHEWPPVCESSFLYFNKQWRAGNKLEHGLYEMKCDFDFGYGYALDGDLVVRNAEWQQFALRHYIQAANDLHVTLTKRA